MTKRIASTWLWIALLTWGLTGCDGDDGTVAPPVAAAAPTIATQPAAASIAAGQLVSFSVVASGAGLTYQWQRNGVDIPGATGATYTTTAAPADNGVNFSVRVTGPGGSVVSATATLLVTAAGVLLMQTGTYSVSPLSAAIVGPAGATLTVSDPADPLAGAVLVFPASALAQDTNVSLSSAPVTSASGLPVGATVRSRAIRLEMTTGAGATPVADLGKLVTITLPTDRTSDQVSFYKIEQDGVLEAMGTDVMDATTSALTFRTRAPSLTAGSIAKALAVGAPRSAATRPAAAGAVVTYAAYVAVGLAQTTLAQLFSSASSIDTGFRPTTNGWFIPNYGSYYRSSRGGNCLGMVGFAKYYYQQAYASPLANTYRDAAPTAAWVDDAVAIELASRVHNGLSDIWNRYTSEELTQQSSAAGVARSMIGALYVTGRPALIYLLQVIGTQSSGAHAISTYKVDLSADGAAVFHVYDPNFPKDDGRSLAWNPTAGFDNYLSGTNAATSNFTYNYFRHIGFYVGMTPQQLSTVKDEADQGFPASVFPTITLTSMTGKAQFDDVLVSVSTTSQGQTEYKTADTAIVIEGTVLGGNAQVVGQVVKNLHVVTPSGNFDATIDNQAGSGTGKFKIVVPLKSGINQVALLATDPNSVSNWAGFREIFVESTAAPSYFSVTLNWDQGTSDIDLYVHEPDGLPNTPFAGKIGDVVYYSNRQGVSAVHPYLDFDNVDGFGPEHYIVEPGLVTAYSDGTSALTANGTYTVGIHYYAWHGEPDATSRSVGWTANWRLLSACNNGCANPETDGLWVAGTQSGTLSVDNYAADGPSGFNAGGASWSNKWNIDFPAPQTSWAVPPSNTIMLP